MFKKGEKIECIATGKRSATDVHVTQIGVLTLPEYVIDMMPEVKERGVRSLVMVTCFLPVKGKGRSNRDWAVKLTAEQARRLASDLVRAADECEVAA